MKKIYLRRNLQFLLLLACTLCGFTMNAQIKVGTNPTVVNSNAILDMESTNKGMLLPRLALTSTSSFAPLTAHVAGMSVYNTATVGDVTPGYYYNDGAKWVRIFGTSAANNTTRGAENLITITNGTGATLTAMVVGVDTAQLKTFLNNKVQVTVSAPFTGNGTSASPLGLTTNNTTAQVNSLITITNGTGATLTAMTVGVDTNALKTFVTNNITSGTISGNNLTAGSLLKTTGTPIGASLKLAGYEVDTTAMKTFIANNVNKAPIKDSIGNAVTNLFNTNAITGKNVTAGSLVTLTGTPTGASVKDFGVAVDTTAMKTFVSNNITNGSISGSNLTAGSLLQTTGTPTGASLKTAGYQVDTTALKTFVTNNITSGAISGSNTTAGSLITVTNGTGASLKAMTVAADTTAMKTFIANNVNKAPIKDSIGNAVTNLFNTNAITGKNVTAGSLVTLTGTPTGASVKDFGVAVDTTAMKTFVSNNITNGSISGSNLTAGSLLQTTGTPTGASLKTAGYQVDTTALKTFVTNNVNSGAITGKNTTAGSLVTVTNGTGASFTSMTVAVDTTAMKTFVSTNITNGSISGSNLTAGSLLQTTGTPTGASLKTAGYQVDTNALKTFVTNNVNSGAITGKNTTAGSLVTVTNGTGASFTSMTVAVDTTAMKTFITNNAPGVTANNTTAGSLITVTNGAGATLTNMTVAADTTAMKTFIANNVNKAPIKDSIGNAVTNLFSTNAITGKNVTAGSLVTLTGTPTGASVKDFGVAVDTTSLKAYLSSAGFDTTSDHWRNNGTATYTTTGFVGINDTNPYTYLVVRGPGSSNDVGHFSNSIRPTSTAFSSTLSINGGFDDSNVLTTTLNTPRIAFGTHTAQRAQIEAGRDTSSANGLDGYLSFRTRDNGTAPFILERMRIASNGNVGIGTTTPSNRLHVKGSTNPLRLEGLQVSTTSDSVLVTDGTGVVKYKSSASIVSNALPKDSILKVVKDSFIQVMNPKLKWFYAPTISISTASLGTGLTKDLYAAYVANFSTPAVKNPGAPATIPVFSASELNYYISQFDAGVISNVSISNTGVMTYDVISTSPSDCSYVNIIFTIK